MELIVHAREFVRLKSDVNRLEMLISHARKVEDNFPRDLISWKISMFV
jgi:hypothetical protein